MPPPSGQPDIVAKLIQVFVDPLLALVFAAGLLVFIFGVVEYMWQLNIKGGSSDEGKSHMIWGLVGMFIMVAAWGIVRIIANTLGV